jgi:deoxyinosine 3'endonuclease (endonuclease V)
MNKLTTNHIKIIIDNGSISNNKNNGDDDNDFQNFDENMIVPDPNNYGLKITLGELKKIQNGLKLKMDLKHTILASDVKYVGGIDIGHHKTDETKAHVVIVIYDYQTMREVCRESEYVNLQFPYIAGFLGFREVEHFKMLLDRIKKKCPQYYPDVLMVDGNGLLHYHGFGSACHIGVVAQIPTIGVGKTLYCMDGLNIHQFKGVKKPVGTAINLTGDSGTVWGCALWNTQNASNCIYVSQGNYISLSEAVNIVLRCSKCRIPEPIRQADLLSKHFV